MRFHKSVVLLILLNVFSAGYAGSVFEAGSGVNIIENTSVVLLRTQVTPQFFIQYSRSFTFRRLELNQQWKAQFYLFNLYIKNYSLFYEKNNLSFELPIDYLFYFTAPAGRKAAFRGGAGLKALIRFDKYSLGENYYYSYTRFTPVPFLYLGLDLDLSGKFSMSAGNSTGACAGMQFFSNSEKNTSLRYYLFFQNNFEINTSIKLSRKYSLLFGWANTLDFYVQFDLSIPEIFFHNYFFTGIAYVF